MRWLTMTHTRRWHAHHHSAGSGHLYQGRFKSFPVQSDEHFHTVCRYVERNALRAGLVERAEHWRWGSLRPRPPAEEDAPTPSPWPIPRPSDWADRVNAALSPAEEEALQRAVRRSQPFGSEPWQADTARRLDLASTLRPRGRPRKSPENGS
jgi:putative transposase